MLMKKKRDKINLQVSCSGLGEHAEGRVGREDGDGDGVDGGDEGDGEEDSCGVIPGLIQKACGFLLPFHSRTQ